MAGVLNFQQYIGGPDQIKIEQIFPSNQKTFLYNFDQDITGWTFAVDYQTLVVDSIAFNRNTGQPNFSAISGTVSGAMIAPILDPELKIPVANALSFLGNHSAVDLIAAGKLPASVTPRKTLVKLKPAVPVSKACNTAATLHNAVATA